MVGKESFRQIFGLKIHLITYRFCCLGLFFALISLVVGKEYKWLFLSLYLYIPILWVLWICTVFFSDIKFRFSHQLYLWVLINFLSLIWLISVALDVENFAVARGVEIAALLMYCPVLIPLAGIFIFFDSCCHFEFIFGPYFSKSASALSIWMELLILSLPQSIAFMLAKRWGAKKKV